MFKDKFLSETDKGEFAIIGKSIIAGLFPIFATISFLSLPIFFSLLYTYLISLIFFALIITFKKHWHQILIKPVLIESFYVTIFIGFGYYALYYYGLKHTSPGNASIIVLLEILFSYIFFNIWKKEHLSKRHLLGASFMIIGALILLFPKNLKVNVGDLFILLATICVPLGNFYQQKIRKIASSEIILFLRTFFAIPFILLLIWHLESATNFSIKPVLIFLIFNGVLHFGLTKILWIEGIHRMSITKATALNSITPFFTLIFSYFILNQNPTEWQILSLLPITLGIYLLTKKQKNIIQEPAST